METNIGSVDRVTRVLVGAVLAVVGVAVFAGPIEAGAVVGGLALLAGGILLGTAATQFCLLYRLVGVNTCPTN
jgi:hypothetical protein